VFYARRIDDLSLGGVITTYFYDSVFKFAKTPLLCGSYQCHDCRFDMLRQFRPTLQNQLQIWIVFRFQKQARNKLLVFRILAGFTVYCNFFVIRELGTVSRGIGTDGKRMFNPLSIFSLEPLKIRLTPFFIVYKNSFSAQKRDLCFPLFGKTLFLW